jgi:hypothetical protein
MMFKPGKVRGREGGGAPQRECRKMSEIRRYEADAAGAGKPGAGKQTWPQATAGKRHAGSHAARRPAAARDHTTPERVAGEAGATGISGLA